MLFVEIRVSLACEDDGEAGDVLVCDRILESMSEPGRAAVEEWSEGDPSPFESETYLNELYAEGAAAEAASDQAFQQADQTNEDGDAHELAGTILTAVLFFAGVQCRCKNTVGAVRLRCRTSGLCLVADPGWSMPDA